MDKTYARFVVTISASVDDINALSDSVENLTQALVDDIDDKCSAYDGSTIHVKLNELKEYDWNQSAQHRLAADWATVAVCPDCKPDYDVEQTMCISCGRPTAKA